MLDDDPLLTLELLVADEAGPVLSHRLSTPVPAPNRQRNTGEKSKKL